MTLESFDGPTSLDWTQRIQVAVNRLLDARRAADELQRDTWQFAVELSCLLTTGICNTELRWMICKGFADHGRELTLPGADVRTFEQTACLQFSETSCFVVTELGQSKLGELAGAVETTSPRVPHWNAEARELLFDGVVVKRFRRPAPNQAAVLAAFEEDHWPACIDDPLPPQIGKDAKPRLHDTINALNRNQKEKRLRFSGDGTGEGVRWETLED